MSMEGGYTLFLSSTGPWGLLGLAQLSESESVALAVPRVNRGLCSPGHDLIQGLSARQGLGTRTGTVDGLLGDGRLGRSPCLDTSGDKQVTLHTAELRQACPHSPGTVAVQWTLVV